MHGYPNLAQIASLIADPSRAVMLSALLGGEALTAGELARVAHIKPQTASGHLAKLVDSGLLVHEVHGRYHYYRLANEYIARALEALNAVAPLKPVRSLKESDNVRSLCFARMCYDHIAGQLGVSVVEKMQTLGYLQDDGDRDYHVTEMGTRWLGDIGINVSDVREARRYFARKCMDWSERRHHLAGALGAAIARRMKELGWIVQISGTRALRVTTLGKSELEALFSIEIPEYAVTREKITPVLKTANRRTTTFLCIPK
ncbi:ArsR/SmtB family transcription factor [Alicyclobacillus sendaiensis]|uniref:ArsR/SmtB family transcription factor n=1 Tax=Alicyclobacillus sendaiensis TaxID=192387 RepID=UPI0026F40C8F|nr:metalloregulator ArsR/SmtB family transcription factor [Alicyclobacillus sendaiensis]